MNRAILSASAPAIDLGNVFRRLQSWLTVGARRTAASGAPLEQFVTTRCMDAGRTLWIARPLGREVTCERGTLWLTFDGQQRDIVLEAGQSIRCDSQSRLAIHALRDATASVA
jgi:hypothetical protein